MPTLLRSRIADERRQEILEVIARMTNEGEVVSVRAIAKAVGLASTASVLAHLNVLEARGEITRKFGSGNTIRPTHYSLCSHCGMRRYF